MFQIDVATIDRMLHMLQWLYTYVANSYSQCFSAFSNVCCKCVYLDVAYVFTHMLQVFYLDVAYVLQWFQVFFKCLASVLDLCFKCFIILRSML